MAQDIKVEYAGQSSDGFNDHGFRIELPDGKKFTVIVPPWEEDGCYGWAYKEGETYGLNLVTDGHYS